jgi:hypothetical protein
MLTTIMLKNYQREDKTMNKTLKYTLAKNLAIGALGLATSLNMLMYNVGEANNLSDKLHAKPMTGEEMNALYTSMVNKVQNIQNVAIGIGGASGLYLIFGLTIPLAGYAIKKKSLEKAAI